MKKHPARQSQQMQVLQTPGLARKLPVMRRLQAMGVVSLQARQRVARSHL